MTIDYIRRSWEQQRQKPETILVVEDDPSLGELLIDVLKLERRYHALLVTDGFQALEAVKTVVPDLLVLDYRLPRMSGLELADRLHAIEQLKHIPTLLISADLPERERKKLHMAFIEKPFEIDELLQTIEHLLIA